MHTYFIYILVNPKNGEVFYVGCTAFPKKRKKAHLRMYINGKIKNLQPEAHYIQLQNYMLTLEAAPQMIIIEKAKSGRRKGTHHPADIKQLERKWIQQYLNAGANLANRQHIKLAA